MPTDRRLLAPISLMALPLVSLAMMSHAAMAAPPQERPYGAWESPIVAADTAARAIGMGDLRAAKGSLYWREGRPQEQGRQVLMRLGVDGKAVELTGKDLNVRTAVHEYGGASYTVLRDGGIVVSNFKDQRLYLLPKDGKPIALTPPDYRYADCVESPAAPVLVCVREDHTAPTKKANGEERNEVVAVPLSGGSAGTVLATGTDFVAYPRLSPDGKKLAWIKWNHPEMPWDTTTLHIADLTIAGAKVTAGKAVQVAGGPETSVMEPAFDADGTLYFVDDRSGWWNLYRWDGKKASPVHPMEREMSGALWQHGEATYALTGDGRAVIRHSRNAVDALGVLDLKTGRMTPIDLPYTVIEEVVMLDSRTAAMKAASATAASRLITVDLTTGTHRVMHGADGPAIDPAIIARPEAIEFPTKPGPDGKPRTAHAWFYPPTNPGFTGPADKKPPLLVMVHGGPTAVAYATLSMGKLYWTSRGFAVVDVNYGGSTTYGREYRRRLNGFWGIVDVADSVAAVDYLVATGRVDPDQVAIRGGSAGGFTALAALAQTDRFKAAANYFGVSDIEQIAKDSHKFERRYDTSLIGPPSPELYRARSPINQLDGFNEPLITFQGSDDKVVPPNQSRMIVDALRKKGVPVAYEEFEGEGHGFRRSETIIKTLEGELYFYGRIFNFTPAGNLPPLKIENLTEH